MRLKPAPKDAVLQERLGLVYAKRKAWKDAKVVFMKACRANEYKPSTTAWMMLGLSCLRLGEYQQAEDALSQANILDHLNPRVWGLFTILCLSNSHNGLRHTQATLCFREALRLGLEDPEILEEIGDLYCHSNNDLAIESYTHLTKVAPSHGDGWQKLADALTTQAGQKELAIQAYKKALELVEGEGNRQKMALTLQDLLAGEGREDEIEPYKKYLS